MATWHNGTEIETKCKYKCVCVYIYIYIYVREVSHIFVNILLYILMYKGSMVVSFLQCCHMKIYNKMFTKM